MPIQEELSIPQFYGALAVVDKTRGTMSLFTDAYEESDVTEVGHSNCIHVGDVNRYFRVRRSEESGSSRITINLEHDRGSSVPAFIYEDRSYLVFSNRDRVLFSFLRKNARPFSFDVSATRFFMKHGYMPPGKTLIREIEISLESAVFDWWIERPESARRRHFTKAPLGTTTYSDAELVERAADALLKTLDEIRTDKHMTIFRMSGGVGSRLILMGLDESDRERLTFESFLYDGDQADRDPDVSAARDACRHLGKELNVYSASAPRGSIVGDNNRSRILTGLYAREFLGGEMFESLPEIIALPARWSRSDVGAREFEKRTFADAQSVGETRWHLDVFRKTYRSTLRGDGVNSWWMPWIHQVLTVSPFLQPEFQRVMSFASRSQLSNHRILVRVLHLLESRRNTGLLGTPMHSKTATIDNRLVSSFQAYAGTSVDFSEPLPKYPPLIAEENRFRFREALRRMAGYNLTDGDLQWAVMQPVVGPRLRNLGVWVRHFAPDLLPDLQDIKIQRAKLRNLPG